MLKWLSLGLALLCSSALQFFWSFLGQVWFQVGVGKVAEAVWPEVRVAVRLEGWFTAHVS